MGRGFESFRPCQKTRNVHSGIPCFFVRGWADSKDERYRANFRGTFATASDQAAQFAARIESFRNENQLWRFAGIFLLAEAEWTLTYGSPTARKYSRKLSFDKPNLIFSLFSSGASRKTVINCFSLAYLRPCQIRNSRLIRVVSTCCFLFIVKK